MAPPSNATGEPPELLAAAGQRTSENSAKSGAGTRILLIDEPGILRDGLCALLQGEGDLHVLAVAGGRREALQTLTQTQPHLVIMDLSASLRTDPETIAHLKRRWPRLRILVLSFRSEEQLIAAALRAGADGYVLKNESRAELFMAIQSTVAGKSYLSPPTLQRVAARGKSTARLLADNKASVLTQREQEVIVLIARGYRTREMAELLSLSHKTVEKHRTNLMRKLGLRSAAAVAAYAINNGYV